MGKDSKIEWCTHTMNPWIGCAKVSAGCKYCYAETLMDTRYGRVEWGPGGTRVRTSDNYWKQPLAWDKEAAASGVRAKVFCGSLCDVFEDREDLYLWRRKLYQLIEKTPNLDWLLLTKRPGQIRRLTAPYWLGKLPDNIWLGASVEDQETANLRIPYLLEHSARIRFVSVEPMLGPVKLHWRWLDELAWVIIGGESGAKARPFALEWAVYLVSQCTCSVKVFVKQIGDNPTLEGKPFEPVDGERLVAKGHEPGQWPDMLRVREFPR